MALRTAGTCKQSVQVFLMDSKLKHNSSFFINYKILSL